jgi:O-antigen ligase
MFIYGLKLLLLAALSMCCFAAVNHKLFIVGVGKRAIIFWLSMLPLIFLINNEPLTLLAGFVLLVFLNKGQSPAISVAFFIIIVSAVPDWVEHFMSAPGVNYLLLLSFDKIAALAILAPLIGAVYKSSRVPWNTTDSLVVAFVFLTVVLTFREGQLTTVMRFLVDSMILIVIPYFVISRSILSMKDMRYCSLAFLILAILLSAVLIVSQIIQIDIYEAFNTRGLYLGIREYRGGFLRLSGPSSGVVIGFLMLAGLLSLDILKKYRLIHPFIFWMLAGSFGLSLLFGGSRGGLMGFILGVGIYAYFIKLAGFWRITGLFVLVLLAILEYSFDITSFLVYEDEYGTFDYRSALYQASWVYLQQYPLFGSHFYLTSGHFDHLITGLGIIDIVSAYLQVGLQYGYVGLLLFVSMYLSVIFPLLKKLLSGRYSCEESKAYVAMYFTLNIVMAVILITTSMVSLFPVFMMVTLALGRSLLVFR